MKKVMTNTTPYRIAVIDRIRGLAAILMLLDHCREFFVRYHFHVLEPTMTTVPIYLTRWITHLAAPAFVFTAGASVYFRLQKAENIGSVRAYLVKRGVFLIFLEFTLVGFLWKFSIDSFFILQVIGTIGSGLILLALTLHFKPAVHWILVTLILIGHNILFYIPYYSDPAKDVVRKILFHYDHVSLFHTITLRSAYPVIPWFGIMLLGFCTAPLFLQEREKMKKHLLLTGPLFIALFALVRWIDRFGNLYQWLPYDTHKEIIFSFFNVCKYPPSLSFVLVIFGILALLTGSGLFDTPFGKLCEVFGRVPLFFYLTHLLLVHLSSIISYKLIKGTEVINVYSHKGLDSFPLIAAWLAFLLNGIILFFLARWYGNLKATSSSSLRKWLI